MSQIQRPSVSSSSGGGNWVRRRTVEDRGIPKFCRCGMEAVIKTSKTVKNPGRLFYCCPLGSEGDTYHLFTWTDERLVEEVEDMKDVLSEVKLVVSEARSDIMCLQSQLQLSKSCLESTPDSNGCCFIL